MKAWLANLPPRERMFVIAGAGLALLIIVWTLAWMPLRAGSAELRDAVADKHRLLANLKRAEAASLGEPAASASSATQSLVVLVDRTHRDHGLAGTLSRNQPDGADGIRITLQGASFDALVSWLGVLATQHGVAVESASFDGGREPGLVSATLVLRRS